MQGGRGTGRRVYMVRRVLALLVLLLLLALLVPRACQAFFGSEESDSGTSQTTDEVNSAGSGAGESATDENAARDSEVQERETVSSRSTSVVSSTAAIVEANTEQSAAAPGVQAIAEQSVAAPPPEVEASIEQSGAAPPPLPPPPPPPLPGDLLSGESLLEAMNGSGAPLGNPNLGEQSTQVPAAGPPQTIPLQESQPVAFVTEPIVPAEQTFPDQPILFEEPSASVEPPSAGEAVFTEVPVSSEGEASAFVEPPSAGEPIFQEASVSSDGATDFLVAANAGDAMAVVDSGGVTATAGGVVVRA